MLTNRILVICLLLMNITANAQEKEIYQLKIYHLRSATQEATMDSFLKDAYLPALHRNGIKAAGVFKPAADPKATEKLVYVFIPFKSLKAVLKLDEKLAKDKLFAADGKNFLDAAYNVVPYERFETILLGSFPGTAFKAPALNGPKKDRVYELRSYEGATEKIFANKVDMFTKGGETEIFDRLGFNAVFYSTVIAGAHMPNLMYMTSFENKAERDKHWEAFGKDEAWKKLSADPAYQHNVSKIDQFMLYPAEYSDF